jgi:S-adenosylmethionine-dependent methyltransferase
MGLPFLTSFDEIATVFADYGKTLRGFVRYKVTQRNLQPYIQRKKLQVLDIGGGSGPDAGWLADQGHSVTLIEPSEKQRHFAQRRFNFFLSNAARKRITILPSALSDLDDTQKYDLVLVHGVAMYQQNPLEFINEAISKVKKGGLVSIVAKGYYGAEARAIHHNDMKGLAKLQKTRRSINNLGREVFSFLPEDIEKVINDNALKLLEWSGIRVITEESGANVADMSKKDLKAILDVEHTQGHNPGIRATGQLLHFIAQKK